MFEYIAEGHSQNWYVIHFSYNKFYSSVSHQLCDDLADVVDAKYVYFFPKKIYLLFVFIFIYPACLPFTLRGKPIRRMHY